MRGSWFEPDGRFVVADAGADFQPESEWALVIGSAWGVVLDPPAPRPCAGHLFSSVAKAEECRALAVPGTAGAWPYPWVWVTWDGGRFRKVPGPDDSVKA